VAYNYLRILNLYLPFLFIFLFSVAKIDKKNDMTKSYPVF